MSILTGIPRNNPKYERYKILDKKMVKGHWNPSKYEAIIRKSDVPELSLLPEVDQSMVNYSALNVACIEDKVKLFWATLPMYVKDKTISDVCGRHADNEVTHGQAYESLANILKLDYEDVNNIPALKGRLDYLTKYLNGNSNKNDLNENQLLIRRIAIFTALMERVSLYTQFYILMSYNNAKRGLKGMYALQKTTAIEENAHFTTGLWITQDLEDELRSMGDDYDFRIELSEILRKGLTYERDMLKSQFSSGEPEHLSYEEVENIMLYNFKYIANAFGIDALLEEFSYDEELFKEKNIWFVEATELTANVDFFDNNVGGYNFEDIDINIEDFTA